MNRNKIRLALGSFIIASSTHAAAYDLSGQVTNTSGSPIEGAKVTLSVAAATGQISGRVTDSATGNGIAGAQVFIDIKPEIGAQSPAIGLTDANGYYTLPELEEGQYTIAMWKRGYETQYHMNVPVVAGLDSNQNITADAVTLSEDKIVLLRAEFDEVKFHPDHDAAWAEQMFFDDTPGAASIRNFYYQLSHGRMDLQKGANVLIHVTDPDLQYPHEDSDRDDIVDWVVAASTSQVNYNDPALDRSASWDHEPGADGRIDHVVVMTAGLPKSITGSTCDMNPVSMLNSEYVTSNIRTPVQALLPEYSPLGNMAHEVFHSMGETAVQDLYIGGTCDVNDELSTPLGTVGKWGTMGIGMYNKLDTFLTDPRGNNCAAGYVDVCAGQDGNCIAKNFGEQPALPVPWTMWKWYHKYFWEEGMVDVQSVPSGQSQTIRLAPYSASNGTQVITVTKSGTSQWWSITNRQPIGFDKGLDHSISGEGQTGILIDFNDPALAGRMQLKGPTRVRDSHPGTLPDYTHYSCRARLDDAAFNVGEVDFYQEGDLTVQLLEEHADGSITVQVSNGVSAPSSSLEAPNALTADALALGVNDKRENINHKHDEHDHKHGHNHEKLRLEVTQASSKPALKQTNQTTPTIKASAGDSTITNAQGNYQLSSVTSGDWTLTFDACGYAQSSKTASVSSNTTVNMVLSEDANRSITANISSPLSGTSVGVNQAVQLNASNTSTFGQTSYLWQSDLDGIIATTAEAAVNLSLGTHNITLSASNELCSNSTSTQVVVVEGSLNELPTAAFSWTASGLSATLTDSSTDSDGTVTAWSWDLGDGTSSTEQNPTVQYAAAGDYQVTLTVSDDAGGQHSTSQTVTVTAPPSDPYALQNGVAKEPMIVGEKEEVFYHIDVPAGVSSMTITLSGDGDGDLYVKHGSEPSRSYGGADYKSTKWKSSETITISNPAQGTWYIMVYGYRAMTTGQLLVSY